MIERTSKIIQGYMCPDFHREECKSAPYARTHGNCGNRWVYALRKPGEGGMLAKFHTPERPERVPEEKWIYHEPYEPGRYEVSSIFYHGPWTISEEGVLHPRLQPDCDMSEPCLDTVETGREGRARLESVFTHTNFIQPEVFWTTLESLFEDAIAQAKRDRAEFGDQAVKVCEHCGGRGLVGLDRETVKP